MKSTLNFWGSHLTKLPQFTRKSCGSHGVNSNYLLNGEDSSVKGGMVL